MPIELAGGGFGSRKATELAGKQELERFLKILAEEEIRNGKPPQTP
jgi:hypothetical protein